jgi:hypothetical protein
MKHSAKLARLTLWESKLESLEGIIYLTNENAVEALTHLSVTVILIIRTRRFQSSLLRFEQARESKKSISVGSTVTQRTWYRSNQDFEKLALNLGDVETVSEVI